MFEMQLNPFDRPFLLRVSIRGEVAVAEVAQGELAGLIRCDRRCVHLAIPLEELTDVDAGRQLDQPLLEALSKYSTWSDLARASVSSTGPMATVWRLP